MILNNATIFDFIDSLMKNVYFLLILAICTIVGGLAAFGYFHDKWQQRKKIDISFKIKTQEEEKQLELEKEKRIRVIMISKKDWEMIQPYVHISGYGKEATFFSSPEEILKANKIVTLNGSPLRQTGGKIYKSIEERLTTNNQIVKLPDGMYAVASKTLLTRAGIIIGKKIAV